MVIRLKLICVVGSCEIEGKICVEKGGGRRCW